jgi:hypothetical protein
MTQPCPICGGRGEHVGACSEVAAIDLLDGTWTLTARHHGCGYREDGAIVDPSLFIANLLSPFIVVPFIEQVSRVVDGGKTLEIWCRIKPGYEPEETRPTTPTGDQS